MKTLVFICTAIVALTSFSSVEAQANNTTKDPNLPDFEYNLTQEPLGNRNNLCEQNKGYCQTNCGGINQDPMNFCNVTTMGWGCGCKEKTPDYVEYQWPINIAHCVGSGEACKAACADDKVPAQDKPKCIEACIKEYSQKCGTPDQPPAYYKVSEISVVPTYAPPTGNDKSSNTTSTDNKGTDDKGTDGSSNNTTDASNEKKSVASSLSFHIGNSVFTLAIVAFGMSFL